MARSSFEQRPNILDRSLVGNQGSNRLQSLTTHIDALRKRGSLREERAGSPSDALVSDLLTVLLIHSPFNRPSEHPPNNGAETINGGKTKEKIKQAKAWEEAKIDQSGSGPFKCSPDPITLCSQSAFKRTGQRCFIVSGSSPNERNNAKISSASQAAQTSPWL